MASPTPPPSPKVEAGPPPVGGVIDEQFDCVMRQFSDVVNQSHKLGPGINVFELFVPPKAGGENCRYSYCTKDGMVWTRLLGQSLAPVADKYVPGTTVLVAVSVPVNGYNSQTEKEVRLFDVESGLRL